MRIDSLPMASRNGAPFKEPYIVIELSFDDANTDLLYLTSHTDADTPAGETVISNVIKDVSGTSQRLDINNFNSTIGNMRFSVVDDAGTFSSHLRTKLASDLSITSKRVRFYLGYADVDFSDYALVQTQIVEREEVQDNTYTIRCYDVQRQQRREIFERKETTLTQNLDFDDLSMTVLSTEGFETYYHGSSYSANPSSTVGHLLIIDGDRFEKITYTAKTGNTFTGLTRGAFGTQALDFIAVEDSKSRNVKVFEYIYLEMPAVKLAYAILTGSLYNDAQTLPAHWHLGIDSQYVATSRFTTIGEDWWDTTDDTKGRIIRFEGLTKEDGKKFIETEIYGLLGCFSPILSTGEMGLSRLSAIVSSANYVDTLDASNIAKASKAVYEHDKIVNYVRIDWGYNDDEDKYRRNNFFYDSQSRTRHGLSELRTLKFRGLHSAKRNGQSIHSVDDVRAMFDGFRDRYAGPPITLTVTVHPSLNTLEVGDVVRVDLTNYPDYFGASDLDRSFEVQQTSVDWDSGKVQLKLAGSTQRATPLIAYEGDETIPSATAVPDALYTNVGTDIETAFAAETSRSGSVVTLNSSVTFTGSTSLDNASVLYVDGDLTIPFGVTLTIEDNVFLKVKGFLNEYGKIDGKGRGSSGEDYRRYMNSISYSPGDHSPINYPTVWNRRINNAYPELESPESFLLWSTSASATSMWLRGGVELFSPTILSKNKSDDSSRTKPWVIPFVNIDPSNLEGLPPTVWGRGGKAGSPLYGYDGFDNDESGTFTAKGQGGNGGNGGAGLVILCRGMDFGAGGQIDLSGTDGEAGTYVAQTTLDGTINVKAGDGAPGRSGLLYILIDGANSSPPDVDSTTVITNNGGAPDLSTWPKWEYFAPVSINFWEIFGHGTIYIGRDISAGASINRARLTHDFPFPRNAQADGWLSNSLVQFLIAPTAAETAPDEITDQPTAISLTEYTNTPQTPEGNKSTIDITVTPPSATNYSYSIIEARKSGDTGWLTVGPAQHEISYTVDSDGSTWEFRALAVSTTDLVLETGPIQSIAVTNFTGNEGSIRPASNVTGLRIAGKSVGQNTFDTPDLQFTWDLNNVLGTGYTDSWFSHFVVHVRQSDGTLIHVETVKSNIYTFTFSENAAASGGPYSSLQIRVYQVTIDGTQSGTPAQVTFTNSAPSEPGWGGATTSSNGATISVTMPSDNDIAAVEVYVDTTFGFTPSDSNKVFEGLSDKVQVADLEPSTTYYVRLRSRDTFGTQSALSVQQSFATTATDWDDLTGAGKPVDNATRNLIFRQASQPTGENSGDLWYDTDDNNRLYIFNGSTWDDSADLRIAQALTDAANAQSTADGKIDSFYQTTAPGSASLGDLWFDTDDGNKIYRYNGSSWVDAQDSDIGQALSDASTAQSTADGKVTTFFQTTSPTAEGVGDLWVDTDDDNHLYRWSGSAWVSTRDGTIATAQATADGKVTTFYSTSTPTAEGVGDLWYNTDTQVTKRWNGSSWVDVANYQDNDNADSSDLIYNSSHALRSPDGGPAGIIATSAAGGTIPASEVDFLDYANGHLKIGGESFSNGGATYRAFKLDANTQYTIKLDVKASVALNSHLYMFEHDGPLDDGTKHVVFNTFTVESGKTKTDHSSFKTLELNKAITTSWVTIEYNYTPTSGAEWASFFLRKSSGAASATLQVRNLSCVPIIDSSADNTQSQVSAGGLIGIDTYDGNSIFHRIHPKMMYLTHNTATHENIYQQESQGYIHIGFNTFSAATHGNFVSAQYNEFDDLSINEWNATKSKRYKFPAYVPDETANINSDIRMSWAYGFVGYASGSGNHSYAGFGFYLDSSWNFIGYCQKSATSTTTPQTVSIGCATDDLSDGYFIGEAVYDATVGEITFTISDKDGTNSWSQTMDVTDTSTVSGTEPVFHNTYIFRASIYKITTGTISSSQNYMRIGGVILEQSS